MTADLHPRRLLRPVAVSALLLFLSAALPQTLAADENERKETLQALFKAVQNDDPKAINDLLESHPDMINAKSPHGQQTPLMSAVLNGKEKAVDYLLERGADVTIGEKDGYTPMHGAGFQGRAKIAKMLADSGVGLRDKHVGDGHEPAVRACWGPDQRHTDTVRFFLEAGVPVEDIFDECVTRTRSPATKEIIEEWMSKKKGVEESTEREEL